MPRPSVTIMVHRDGSLESRSYRVPIWLLRLLAVTASAVLAAILLAAVLYAPIARTAARVPRLEREIARLTAENLQVTQLAYTLQEMEAHYAQVRQMLGADLIPEALAHDDLLAVAYPLFAAVPGSRGRYTAGPSLPVHRPLDDPGVITRGLTADGGRDEVHPGVDVAVPPGTPIRAAGGGTVLEAGNDPEYGLFVLIGHPDGYQSMYGHASRVLVLAGQEVGAGQVIGLTGSTGRSTAPHLHFEIRRGGAPVDPNSIVTGDS